MRQIAKTLRGLLLGTALIAGCHVQAQNNYENVHITPAPGVVQHLSEFELHFDGNWGLGTERRGKITVTGPEGVEIPKVYSSSMGGYYLIYFEDEAVINTPGEYTLTIAKGKFAINEVDLDEMTFNYTIENNGTGNQLPEYTINPEPGDYDSIDGSFMLTFDTTDQISVKHSQVSLRGPEGYVPTSTYAGANGTITVSPQNAAGDPTSLTRPGVYRLTFAEGSICVGEATNEKALVFEYTIAGGQPEPWIGTYTFSPADGSTVEGLKDIEVTFVGAKSVDIYQLAGPSLFPALYNKETNTNVASCAALTDGNVLYLSLFSAVTEPGTYELIIPTGFIYVDNAHPAEDVKATYIIEGQADAFEYTYTIEPQDGSIIGADEAITITFAAEGLKKVESNMFAWGTSMPHFTNEMGAFNPNLQATPNGNSYTFTHQWPFEVDGDYTLTIPAEYFTLTNDANQTVKNKTIKVTYHVSTSAVRSLTVYKQDVEIYTITGIKVQNTKALPAGVYIINGKKAYIK